MEMIPQWWMIVVLLKVSLLGQMLAAPDNDGHRCQNIDSMSTSVVDGYIEDTPTGINFFYEVAPNRKSMTLSWFLPSQRILDAGNITFWIYKDTEKRHHWNLTTASVNDSHTFRLPNDVENVQLRFRVGNVTSMQYCCAIVACYVIPPPSVELVTMHQPENTEKIFVELEGTLAEKVGFFSCFAKYRETSSTGDAHNETKVECEPFGTSCSLEHLPPHTAFEVRMGCKGLTSSIHAKRIQWSQPLPFITLDIAPGNVMDVQYSNVGHGVTRSVLITWQPVPETQRNGLILFYTVNLTRLGPRSLQQNEVHNTTALNYTFNGLEYACNYSVIVTASNGVGEGRPQRRILEEYKEKPSQPTLSVSSVTARKVTLVWHPPERPYGIVTYRLLTKVGDTLLKSTEQLSVSPNLTTGQYSYSLEDLEPHTRYTLTLRTENHAKHCDVDLRVTTREEAPSAPPATLTVIDRPGHPTELRVKWMPVPGNETNGDVSLYTLSWWLTEVSDGECHHDQKADNKSEFHHNITDSSILSYDITGLSSNSTYCVAITASTEAGEGPIVTTLAKTVKDFIQVKEAAIMDVTSGSVFLRWRLSIPVDSVGVSTDLMVDGREVDLTNKSSHLLKNLTPYTTYNISIKACWIEYLEKGCGPAKYMAVRTIATTPTAPLKLTLNYLGENHVNLSWEEPAFPNSPISHYRVVYYETSRGDDSKIEQNTTKQNIPDIQVQCNDFSTKEYIFEVSAVLYALPELDSPEGPPANISKNFCSNRSVMGIIITVVIVPCCIIIICVLLVWWFFLYPKKKIDIKIAKSIYHPKIISSTGKVPEKEVFDTLNTKSDVMECETYMIMKPSRNPRVNDNNLPQDYLKMSKTYITDAT